MHACSGRSCILGAGTLVGRHERALRGARRASALSQSPRGRRLVTRGQHGGQSSRWSVDHPRRGLQPVRARATCFVPRYLGPPRTGSERWSPRPDSTRRWRTCFPERWPGSRQTPERRSCWAPRAGRDLVDPLRLASLLLWSPEVGYVSLLGLIVAMTPMVIFVSSMLSNSALETAAGLTFAAAIVRLARPGAHGYGCGPLQLGAADFSRRSYHGDPLDDLRGGALLHPRRSLRHSGKRACQSLAADRGCDSVGRGGGCQRAWEATYGTGGRRAGPLAYPWMDKISEAISRLPRLGGEWIGTFGWLDTRLPRTVFLTWLGLGAAIVSVAVSSAGHASGLHSSSHSAWPSPLPCSCRPPSEQANSEVTCKRAT